MGNGKIIGFTSSVTFLAFISLSLMVKSLDVLLKDFFIKNALYIFIITSALVLIFIITGAISLTALLKRGKS